MKQANLKLRAIFALLALFFAACQKDNTAEQLEEQHRQQQQLKTQRFLTLPPEPDTCLVRIAAELSKINNERTTLPHFADMFGYPKWQHAQIFETNGILNCFVPLGNDSKQQVGAILHTYFSTDGNRLAFVLITKSNINEVIAAMPDSANKPSRVMYKAFFAMHQNTVYGLGGQTEVLLETVNDTLYYYNTATMHKKNTCNGGGLKEVCTWKSYYMPQIECLGGGYWREYEECVCVPNFGSSTSPISNIGSNNNFPSVFDSPGGGGGGGGSGNSDNSGDSDLWGDWGNSSGGGSGGFIDDDPPVTGGGYGTPSPEQPESEPFDQEKFLNEKLGKDSYFTNRMRKLLDTTKMCNVEFSSSFRQITGENLRKPVYYPYNIIKGEDGYIEPVIYTIFKTIGIVHTHNKGRGSTFSFGDLVQLCVITQDNGNDLESLGKLFVGMIGVDGETTYMLMIEDETAFKTWRRTIMYKTEEYISDMDENFYKEYLTDVSDYQKCEDGFMRYLSDKKTGLRLYKGNTKDFSTWVKK